ncbi:hypothetical protein ASG11_16335 [Sphingomonas sp. Leaf357]|uniref:APC family permease n=1 Tax=Sphingomonas sp. Leaf357 TaxID=1736350 RepID=UPI000700DE5B|nr:amino acid permease [Sphingomonas sp. Leaf357]KQS02327.1 hypothetical protein ASG11_16335 [Sphingomonas sp. Leaf357]
MTTETRPFGFWTATALIMGGMIGSGIFLLPVAIAPYGWIGVVAWIVSILGVLAIGYAVAAMARLMPEATGSIAVTGAVLGPLAGVLVGWSYWISCWTAIAAIAGAAISYLSVFVPWLGATPLNGALATVALIWLLTLTNLAGTKLAGQVQVATTILKLVPLIVVVLIVIWLWGSGRGSAPPWPGTGPGYAGLTAAITLTLFPLIGFEAAGCVAERVQDPGRNIMRATVLGIALTGLLYILVSSGMAFALPAEQVAASPAPFALFVETFVGRGAGLFVAAFAAIAAVGCLNGWVLIQGEVPLGMGRAGLLPEWFAVVNARDVSVRMQLVSSGLASLLVFSTASRSLSGAFQFAALLTTCAALWLYAAISLAALVRRVAAMPAALGLGFSVWAMWGAGVEASAWGFALMLTGWPLYWWAKRAPTVGTAFERDGLI